MTRTSRWDQAHPFGLPTGDRIDIRNMLRAIPYDLSFSLRTHGTVGGSHTRKAFEPRQRLLAYLIVHSADGSAAALSSAILHSNQLGEN